MNQRKVEGYEDCILVDLSSISLRHDGDKSSFPPAYDPKEVISEYEKRLEKNILIKSLYKFSLNKILDLNLFK